MRQVAGLADDQVARSGEGQRQGQAAHPNGFGVGIRAIDIRHVNAVGVGRAVQRAALAGGGLVVRAVAGRADVALARAPPFRVVILGGFIHLGDRNRGAVDGGFEDAIVGRTVRVVAGGTGEGCIGDGDLHAAVGGAITPGQVGVSRAGHVVVGGDREGLVEREAARQQGGVVGGVGRAVSAGAAGGQEETVLDVGIRARAGASMTGHAQSIRAGLYQQVRTDGGVRPVTTRAGVGGGSVTAMRAAVGGGRPYERQCKYDHERKRKHNFSHKLFSSGNLCGNGGCVFGGSPFLR